MKNRLTTIMFLVLTALLVFPALAFADEAKIDTGDTGFILVCAALVLLMTPALALFYGGMSRKKNVLNTMMMSFIVLGIVTVQWVICGYSLAFGTDIKSLIGSLDLVGLKGVGLEPFDGTAIPHAVFMVFQMMFALITAAIISGAVAERMRFGAYVLFILIWTTVVYDPLAHWVWGGGWLFNLGALDFAGGTVVHISSGVSALVACIMLGKRKGYGSELMIPHNLPITVLGAALLWFGWFGFNAGSALGANEIAANAFVTTQIATGAAVLSWALLEWIRHGKPTMLGAASGCIAGLVAITPACGFVTPLSALIMGLLVSPICYFAVSELKHRLNYDDSLDAFGIHGVGGTFGAIATGVFASPIANPGITGGLLSGNPHQLIVQLISVVATIILAALATFVILKVVGAIVPLRVNEEEEEAGLDFTEHGEDAYSDSVLGSPLLAFRPSPGATTQAPIK